MNKKLIVIISFLTLLIIIIFVSSNKTPKDAPTTNPQYFSNKTYCEKDSDCTTQETKKSLCCGNACPDVVNVYNKSGEEIVCKDVGCTDHYFVCPEFEVKCINNRCRLAELKSEWAITVLEGVNPQDLASSLGFEYAGPIGELENTFLFKWYKQTKIQLTPEDLLTNPNIKWFEKQIPKKLYPR